MKKTVLMTALLLVGTSTAAFADIGKGLVGNTVVLKNDAGDTSKIYYATAKKIEVQGPDGHMSAGQWRVMGDKICTTVAEAPENCTDPIKEPPVVGSGGTIEGPDGAKVEWSVVAGKGF